jgi:hypothetical protein
MNDATANTLGVLIFAAFCFWLMKRADETIFNAEWLAKLPTGEPEVKKAPVKKTTVKKDAE